MQGDGEVCVTAIETELRGTLRVSLLKQTGIASPWAETPTHFITMGFDEDLDKAAEFAVREMVKLAGPRRRPFVRGRLHLVQPRRRRQRHATGQCQQRYPCDASEGLAEIASGAAVYDKRHRAATIGALMLGAAGHINLSMADETGKCTGR